MADTTPERLIGTVTGGYRVLSRIGSGAMGHVYEAEDVDTGKRVALKVLHRSHQKELAARFLREGKTLALLSHPNIVQLADMGQLDDGALFLATELIPSGSLRALMDKGPLDQRRALSIIRQLLDALTAAHELGVVHRDIKPENVMISDRDVVKVLDFGVAKLLADTVAGLGEANLTSIGFSIFGSALYIAPESVTGQPVDARIDLYSAGAMLFEMLTGRPPFNDEDPAVILRQHAFEAPPSLQQVAPAMTFDPAIETLVARALAKQPDDRYPSAANMIAAVDSALSVLDQQASAEQVRARTSAAVRASSAPADIAVATHQRARTHVVRLSRRKQLAIGAGAAVMIAVVAGVVFAGRGTSRSAAPAAAAGLANRANDLVGAGRHRDAVQLLERELAGTATAEQSLAYLALGHARFSLGERRQALAAYERALRASSPASSDAQLRANLMKTLEGKDQLASVLAIDLLAALAPPELDAIVAYASSGKLVDARHRAVMVAERDGAGEKVDRVGSWIIDLQQSSVCDERKRTIDLLARAGDRRALAPLKRLRAVKCLEPEVIDALARIDASAK
jgi:tetratricopeptide (TPR) repeat protein